MKENDDAIPTDIQADAEFSGRRARRSLQMHLQPPRRARTIFADPIPDAVLARILKAAHHAPSVGFMQPWDFIVVRSPAIKQKVRDAFSSRECRGRRNVRGRTAEDLSPTQAGGDRRGADRNLRHLRPQPHRQRSCSGEPTRPTWISTARFARCKTSGSRRGWKISAWAGSASSSLTICAPRSAFRQSIQPIAYLCVGYVSHFLQKPELETAGWLPRVPLSDAVWIDRWQARDRLGSAAAMPLIGSARLNHRKSVIPFNKMDSLLGSSRNTR